MCIQFLISFKQEDSKPATESHLASPSPNNASCHTHSYVQNAQYSFRFQVADVSITISTSKPIPLNHLFAFPACFKKPYILGVSDEISQHLLSL